MFYESMFVIYFNSKSIFTRAKALFIFPTEFTADSKKFSLEEKNRKKSYKQPHSQRDKLKLFQKYLLSRSFTLFAAFRSHFVLSSLVENLFARARVRGIFRSLPFVLSFLRDRSEREKMTESEKFLSHTHTKKVSVWHALLQFYFLRWCECDFVFLFVLVCLKN